MNPTGPNGLRTFGLLAAVMLALSWVSLEPAAKDNSSVYAAGDGFGDGLVAAGDDLAGEPVDLDGDGVIDVGGGATAGSTTRRVTNGGTGTAAGTSAGAKKATGGTAGSAGTSGSTGTSGGSSGGGATVGGGAGGGAGGSGTGGGGAFECKAGRNGGATAPGVTGDRIKLATTAALDGEASSLLKASVTGMKAVVDQVNQSGGICGRRLDLKVVNDGFKDADGQRYIRTFIEEDYFALPVVPSAEGLGAAILSGDISKAGIPVVGTDGMRREQYAEPWVWPVAASTTTVMRVMADYGAKDKNAQSFAIVYDRKYKFGIEGKNAFVQQVEAMGKNVVAEIDLDPEAASYTDKVQQFNNACGDNKCDMVALLLLPDTAQKWLSKRPARARVYTAGAQTLFTTGFAQACVREAGGDYCHGIAVWTGYNPPIGAHASKPGVATFVERVRALDPGIDVRNQFLEGAYLGMSVFVEALKRTGPNLTRENLKATLDAMDYDTDLTSRLSWRPGDHRANKKAQAFSINATQGTFNDWTDENTGFRSDPNPGAG